MSDIPQEKQWLVKYFNSIGANLGEPVRLDLTAGAVVEGEMSEAGYQNVFVKLNEIQQKNRTVASVVDRMVGHLILHYADTRRVGIEEAITQLDLHTITGKAPKTLSKLPRMVSLLPEEVFQLPLHTIHFEGVTAFGGPKDDLQALANFNEERVALLHKMAEDPRCWTRARINTAMKELQAKYSVFNNRMKPLSLIVSKFVEISVLLAKDDVELEELGLDRNQVRDHWNDFHEQLVERNYCPGEIDAEHFTPPWVEAPAPEAAEPTGQVIEAEQAEAPEPEVAEQVAQRAPEPEAPF